MLTYDELLKENHLLKEEVLILRAQIKELLEKLNTNSNNSSRPPSQDPNRKKRANKPTGRSKGVQIGHKGHGRRLIPEKEVNQIIEVKPHDCPNGCCAGFDSKPIFIEVRQVFELPEINIEVTQYNRPLSKLITTQSRVLFQLVGLLPFGPYCLNMAQKVRGQPIEKIISNMDH